MNQKKLIITFVALLSLVAIAFIINSTLKKEDAAPDMAQQEDFNEAIPNDILEKYAPDFSGFQLACSDSGGTINEEEKTCTFAPPIIKTASGKDSRAWGREPGTWQAANATFDAQENALGLCKTLLFRNHVELLSYEQASNGISGEVYLDLEDSQWIEYPSPKNAPLKYNLVTNIVCKFVDEETFEGDGLQINFYELYRRR
tara:strand:+ start:8513 stop:9115 length:603 start_codon:yes stop_codon:yes gene_type:complete